MQIIRTLGWVLLTALVVTFVMVNYGEKHDVIIWPTSNDALVFNWPVGIIALVFWLLGVVPMWAYNRSVKWSLGRRIRSLENTLKSSAIAASRKDAAENEAAAVNEPVNNPVDAPAKAGDNPTALTPADSKDNP